MRVGLYHNVQSCITTTMYFYPTFIKGSIVDKPVNLNTRGDYWIGLCDSVIKSAQVILLRIRVATWF